MGFRSDPVRAVVEHVDKVGVTSSSRRRVADWGRRQPGLTAWSTAGEIAAAVRAAGTGRGPLLAALLAVAEADELAEMTVVSGIADRLEWVVSGWARAGVPAGELEEMAADLVTGAWAAVTHLDATGSDIDRLVWTIVDRAREAVRVPRRRQRRADHRRADLAELDRRPADEEPGPDLDEVLVDAVRDGRLTPRQAAPIFLTRVAGFGVGEAAGRLGWSETNLLTTRWRAEQKLTAA